MRMKRSYINQTHQTPLCNVWQRELKDFNKNISIKVDKEFVCFRQRLASQRKWITQLNKGKKYNSIRQVTEEKIDKLLIFLKQKLLHLCSEQCGGKLEHILDIEQELNSENLNLGKTRNRE